MTEAAANPALPHRLDWDGGVLRLGAAPGAAIEIWLDEQPYARLCADGSGLIELALPLAPNGRERINLQLRAGAAQSATIALQYGRPGLARAGDVLPPAPLSVQDYVDVTARAARSTTTSHRLAAPTCTSAPPWPWSARRAGGRSS